MTFQFGFFDIGIVSSIILPDFAKLSDPQLTILRCCFNAAESFDEVDTGAQVAELAPIACASNMTCEVVPSSLKSTTETFPSDEVHNKQPLVHEEPMTQN